jgi:SAM-dependent methyltransferase
VTAEPYDREFFAWLDEGSVSSARVVAPIVLDLLPVRSVVDVGCGLGAWAGVFRSLGVERVIGIDGAYVDRSALAIPEADFVAHDLCTPLPIDEQFDLVVCLEVAEHLPPRSGPGLVETLTNLGPAVLFSAAVPSQGGTNHVNERWPEYWVALFAARGYAVVDCIRPHVWSDERVEPWYAQNTLLFVAPDLLGERPALQVLADQQSWPLSVVHPRLFLSPEGRYSTTQLLRLLKASVSASLKRAGREVGAWRGRAR